MSTATDIAALFNNDGAVWDTEDGRQLWDECESRDARWFHNVLGGNACVAQFDDLSAIVMIGDGWYLDTDADDHELVAEMMREVMENQA